MELKNLFLINLTKNNETMIAKESTMNHYKQYPQWYGEVVVIEELGKLWVGNTKVEVIGERSGNCYVAATYKITTDHKLNKRDMDIIRAQYPFISGQKTADVNLESFKEIDGKFEYVAYSECDSGD